ncbi:hypothetical protein O3P69_019348 [Scylla paramamosain]|uniref:Uncharacterized protein n=1 Tax=Scylla paramamosain TaxID=85552 RepID=A0AAW0SVD6_SCYPA
MPFPARRGRAGRRFSGNVNKPETTRLPPPAVAAGQGRPGEYEAQVDPMRRVPHYEEDPNWICRGQDTNPQHYPSTPSFDQCPQEPQAPPNPRGSWGAGRKGRGRGRGEGSGAGWGLRRPDPPLVWSGIPHLEHSFVIQKDHQAGQGGQGGPTAPAGSGMPWGPHGAANNTNAGQEYRQDWSQVSRAAETVCLEMGPQTGQGGGTGTPQNARGGPDTPPRPQNTPGLTTGAGEGKELETKSENKTPNKVGDNANVQTNAESSAAAAADANTRGVPQAPETLPGASGTSELENETKRYYQELFENEDKTAATQVAQITVECRTVEAERQRKEGRQREEVEREKRKREEEEAAWDLLHQLWEFSRCNPYDFDGWTRLLGHVEVVNNLEAKLSDMEAAHGEEERALGTLLLGTEVVPFCVDLWLPLIASFTSFVRHRGLSEQCIRELYEDGLQHVGQSWGSSPLWDDCIAYEQGRGDLVAVMRLYRRLIGTPLRLYNKHWDHFLALVRDHHPHDFLTEEEYQSLRKEAYIELRIKPTVASSSSSSSSSSSTQQARGIVKSPQPEDRLTSLMKEKIVASYIKTHEGTEKEVDKRWKFEEKIKRPYFHVKPLDRKRLKNWREYLDFELLEGDPVKIVTLFERCLVACALYEDIWCKYAEFMERHVQDVIDGKYKDWVSDGAEVNDSKREGNLVAGSDGEPSKVTENEGNDEENGNSYAKLADRETGAHNNKNNNNNNKNETTPAEKENGHETFQEIRGRLINNLSLNKRVIKCPSLTQQWILNEVTWEDVRQVYKRAAWIHCSGKAAILIQWAEFEEVQGNVDTARELLASVISKHPTLIKARMQLIEVECRAGRYNRVEELYGEASKAVTLPKHRAWLAMKFARFLFKTLQEPERALVVLRKALKKDRGNTLLYHHVFDICYQRHPIDVQGVLASTLLALASKDLSLSDKCWFAFKRLEFLKEHGSIAELKHAQHELISLRLAAERERLTEERERGGNVKEEEEGGGGGGGGE